MPGHLQMDILYTQKYKNFFNLIHFRKLITLRHLLFRRNTIKEYKRKINDMHLGITRSIITSKLEKSTITMLYNIYERANVNLSKLIKFKYFTEEQYIMNKDNAKILARKCETHAKHVELLFYCEKETLNVAKNQKRWISERLRENLQMLYDVKYMLKHLEMKANNYE